MANQSASVSFPLFGILGVVFVALKLAEVGAVAGWSWWWVLAPFWAPWVIALSLVAIVLVLRWLAGLGSAIGSRRRLREMLEEDLD